MIVAMQELQVQLDGRLSPDNADHHDAAFLLLSFLGGEFPLRLWRWLRGCGGGVGVHGLCMAVAILWLYHAGNFRRGSCCCWSFSTARLSQGLQLLFNLGQGVQVGVLFMLLHCGFAPSGRSQVMADRRVR